MSKTSHDKILEMLEIDAVDGVVKKIMSGAANVRAYAVRIGVEHIAASIRRQNRRELKITHIKPSFISKTKGPTGSVGDIEARKFRRNIVNESIEVFSRWYIGDRMLGDHTKQELLVHAGNERKSSAGHLYNAMFYERLAAPMSDTELVKDHWQSLEAVEMLKEQAWRDAGKTSGAGPNHPSAPPL